jgi:hypothetical protein
MHTAAKKFGNVCLFHSVLCCETSKEKFKIILWLCFVLFKGRVINHNHKNETEVTRLQYKASCETTSLLSMQLAK